MKFLIKKIFTDSAGPITGTIALIVAELAIKLGFWYIIFIMAKHVLFS